MLIRNRRKIQIYRSVLGVYMWCNEKPNKQKDTISSRGIRHVLIRYPLWVGIPDVTRPPFCWGITIGGSTRGMTHSSQGSQFTIRRSCVCTTYTIACTCHIPSKIKLGELGSTCYRLPGKGCRATEMAPWSSRLEIQWQATVLWEALVGVWGVQNGNQGPSGHRWVAVFDVLVAAVLVRKTPAQRQEMQNASMPLGFSLNGAELSLNSVNSVNSKNLRNHWSSKHLLCYLCLCCLVVSSQSLTQEILGSDPTILIFDFKFFFCHWIQQIR